jgi:hypothetical protein
MDAIVILSSVAVSGWFELSLGDGIGVGVDCVLL